MGGGGRYDGGGLEKENGREGKKRIKRGQKEGIANTHLSLMLTHEEEECK